MVVNGSNECVRLGDLNSAITLPVCPMNSDAGVRVVYSNGDKGERFNWAVIYDFKCDITGSDPPVIFENPENTIKVLWRWTEGPQCVYLTGNGTCPQYNYGSTYATQRFRPRPMWFEDAKFGIFIHWGVFSVPAYKNEWYWHKLMGGDPDYVNFHNHVYGCSGVDPDKFPCDGAKFTYYDFPPMFQAELFDPDHWASVFSKAGAKYVVLTSKHHEGWCNFNSSYHWNWDSVSLGPHRDLVMDLTTSVKKSGMIMGLYHSLREWYHPLYVDDENNNCTTDFPGKICNPTMIEMIARYEPWLLWNDGPGDSKCQRNYIYWKAEALRNWMYNESPVKNNIVVNTRCGTGCIGDYKEGGDRFTASEYIPYKWESGYTIQAHSWGYDRTNDPFLSVDKIIHMLVLTVSRNGNLLLNVGPTADGRLDPLFEERLLDIGAWLDVNGEAIYSTVPWRVQNDTAEGDTWYTAGKDGMTVYAITFSSIVPGGKLPLVSPLASSSTKVSMLGYSGNVTWSPTTPSGLAITVPLDLDRDVFSNKPAVAFKLAPVS
jgi:alpha-L-fucosidase